MKHPKQKEETDSYEIGDLVESGFKRKANVKDSGNSIPGIGGALDLMDSLILSAPVGYLLLRCFIL